MSRLVFLFSSRERRWVFSIIILLHGGEGCGNLYLANIERISKVAREAPCPAHILNDEHSG